MISDLNPQKEHEMLKSLVNDVNDSIMITTSDLEKPGPTILFVNPAFTRMTGYSAEEVIGKSPRLLQGEKTDRKTLDRMKEVLPTKHEFKDEIVNYKKNGEEYYIEWNISAIKDKDGKILNWISIQRDITDRKRLQLKLEKTNEIIEKKVEERTQELEKLKIKLEKYSHRLELKLNKLEKDIKLTDKERKVFSGMMCNPYMNDKKLAELLSITRPTVTSIRNRLIKNKWLKPLYIPDLERLGCGILSVGFGKDAVSDFSQTFKVLDKQFQKPESIFLFSTNEDFFNISAISQIEEVLSNKENLNMPFSCMENFLDFSLSMPSLLKERPCIIIKDKVKKEQVTLKTSEKTLLYHLCKFPNNSFSRLSSVSGLSMPTISKAYRRLKDEEIFRKIYLPNMKLLQKEILFMEMDAEKDPADGISKMIYPFIFIRYEERIYLAAIIDEEKEHSLTQLIDQEYNNGKIKNYPRYIKMRPQFVRFHKIEFHNILSKLFGLSL